MRTFSKIILVAVFFLLVWLSNLYGQTTKNLDPFDAISITGNVKVLLKQGDTESAEISAIGIPEDKLTVTVNRGVLKLKLLNSIFYKNDEVRVVVTYKTLRRVKAQAGAEVRSNNVIETDKLEVIGNSGAHLKLELNVNALDATASEGAIVKLKGKAGQQHASSSTGAQYEGESLLSEKAYVKAGTGGQVYINVTGLLEASANTGGTIEYDGNPNDKQIKTLLGGTVRGS